MEQLKAEVKKKLAEYRQSRSGVLMRIKRKPFEEIASGRQRRKLRKAARKKAATKQ